MTTENFAFGSFRLVPAERILLDDGKPLRLGNRALDILITLVEQAGKLVAKDVLIARAWPDTTVDEASLRVQIAALRKTLGDGRDGNRFITNIPGRGYSFVASATSGHGERLVRALPAARGNAIPTSLTRIIGRAHIITALGAQLERRRLVTIVGPGGIGKTTIAEATRALAAIAAGAGLDARREMQLHAALAQSLMFTRGAVSEVGAVGTKALEIAETLGDAEYQLRSLKFLWSFHHSIGWHCVALTLAQRFYTLAAKRSDPKDHLIGERLIGTSRYSLGDLVSARRHLDRALAGYVGPTEKGQIVRFVVDQWVAARVNLALVLWLQGLPDQAMRTAESSIEDARATNHAISLGFTLSLAACQIALWVGDPAAAEHYAEMLLDHVTRHGLTRWRAFCRSYQGVLAIHRGDLSIGLRLLRDGIAEPAPAGSGRLFRFVMAEAFGRAGQIVDGFATVEEAIVRSERTGEERWATAELLRIKGELLLLQGVPGAFPAAEGLFRQALDWARSAGRTIVGTARHHEPCPAIARPGPEQRGIRPFGTRLRSVHRGLRDGRFERGKEAARRTGVRW